METAEIIISLSLGWCQVAADLCVPVRFVRADAMGSLDGAIDGSALLGSRDGRTNHVIDFLFVYKPKFARSCIALKFSLVIIFIIIVLINER